MLLGRSDVPNKKRSRTQENCMLRVGSSYAPRARASRSPSSLFDGFELLWPATPDHVCTVAIAIEPATASVPAREVLRIFVFIFAAASATTALSPTGARPLHASSILCTPTSASLLVCRELSQRLTGREASQRDDRMRAKVGNWNWEMSKRKGGCLERLERVEKLGGRRCKEWLLWLRKCDGRERRCFAP